VATRTSPRCPLESDVDSNSGVGSKDLFGLVTVPNVPFRVAVRGLDTGGTVYERLFPTVFRPQTVLVNIASATVDNRLPIGRSTEFLAQVRNLGPQGTFHLTADATSASVDNVSPNALTLNAGETGNFIIRVTVPADIPDEMQIFLVATVVNAAQPTLTNTATLELVALAEANTLPIADAGPNQTVRLGASVRLNGSGSFDPDNGPQPLSFAWAQLSGPELTSLRGATTPTPSFTPHLAGSYTFALVVSDGEAKSGSQVTVVVRQLHHEKEKK
jgi:hypothetical protein